MNWMTRHTNLLPAKRQFRIENKSSGTAEIYIYDEISLFGITAQDFTSELKSVTSKDLNVYINSPGGDVFDGIAIMNSLRGFKGQVNVQVDGVAASAASFIAMAGDHIAMAKNSMMMIHEAHGLGMGNAADMRDLASRLDQMSDNIASIYADRAGGEVSDWRAKMKDETWFTAQETVDVGLASAVVGSDSGATNAWERSMFSKSTAPEDEEFTFDPNQFRELLKEACSG